MNQARVNFNSGQSRGGELWLAVIQQALNDVGVVEGCGRYSREADKWIRDCGKGFRDVCTWAGLNPVKLSKQYLAGKLPQKPLSPEQREEVFYQNKIKKALNPETLLRAEQRLVKRDLIRGKLPSKYKLHQLFDYDPSGNLVWKFTRARMRKGEIAGQSHETRLKIGWNGEVYLAHRLIWKWHYGDPEDKLILHINCDPWDNRIENLELREPL